MLARVLVGAAVAWPLLAGAALWQRATASPEPVWATVVYAAAGRVCHQRPERSFHVDDAALPVCARCTGLYVAAPIAAFIAFRRRTSGPTSLRPLHVVAIAAIPTVLTLLWEWGGLGTPSNLVRFLTALPLGAAIAFVVIATVTEPRPSESIR